MRKSFYIIIGMIMMAGLAGCSLGNDGASSGSGTSGAEIEQIPSEELEALINPDNMIFDYYEAVVATVGGDGYDEFVLYTRDDGEGLILAKYSKWHEQDEKCLCCLVPGKVFDECMKTVKKHKMHKWKDGFGITGKVFVVRFPGSDGEMVRVTSDDMPDDGVEAFDAVCEVLTKAWSENYVKPSDTN